MFNTRRIINGQSVACTGHWLVCVNDDVYEKCLRNLEKMKKRLNILEIAKGEDSSGHTCIAYYTKREENDSNN